MRLVINNRLDGEEPGQPSSAAVARAAADAGLAYVHAPVAGGLSREVIGQVRAALAAADGAVLLYCKSGYRSALVWAAARVADGMEPDAAVAAAARAGWPLGPQRGLLEAVRAACASEA